MTSYSSTAAYFGYEVKKGTARRIVIRVAVVLLGISGSLVGAGVGAAWMHHRHGPGAVIASVLLGIGSALGSWLVAALLSLFVEIADSLRLIAASDR
jgi:hypothetical protein